MQSVKFFFFVFVLLALFSPKPSFAEEVVINEFSSNSNPEWVELYNSGSSLVDLTGWTISDEAQSPKPLSGSISPQGYLVYENAQGWLNNSGGDTITIKDSSGVAQNTVEYGKSGSVVGTPDSDKSAARTPDGNAAWQNNVSSTKGAANPSPTPSPTPSLTPTPTPTPTTSPSPAPTSTPTPAPSPTKTPTPFPTKTATPKPTLTPSPRPSSTPEALVLGLEFSSSASASPLPSVGFSLPIIPISLIILGVLFLGSSAFFYFKNRSLEGKGDINAINNKE